MKINLFPKRKHNIVSLLEERRELACKKYRSLKCKGCPYCINTTGEKIENPTDEMYRTCAVDRVIHVERWN